MGNYHILNVILQVLYKVGTVDVPSCGCLKKSGIIRAATYLLAVLSLVYLSFVPACSVSLLLSYFIIIYFGPLE